MRVPRLLQWRRRSPGTPPTVPFGRPPEFHCPRCKGPLRPADRQCPACGAPVLGEV